MNRFSTQLLSLLLAGMIILGLIFGIMLLAWLIIFAVVVGCVIFFIRLIREKFFPSPKVTKHKSGRIIDSNDWKKL